jgi:hypothetical protein
MTDAQWWSLTASLAVLALFQGITLGLVLWLIRHR